MSLEHFTLSVLATVVAFILIVLVYGIIRAADEDKRSMPRPATEHDAEHWERRDR